MCIIDEIRKIICKGTIIPRPRARKNFKVKGWGMRRGKEALIYYIPNNKGGKPYEKGVTISEFIKACKYLKKTGTFTSKWFKKNMRKCYDEGSCNFSTIGGIFEIFDLADYKGPTQGYVIKSGWKLECCYFRLKINSPKTGRTK